MFLRLTTRRCFLLHTFWYKSSIYHQKRGPTVLARQASYDKKTLARQVIPLALGYRTALSSRPVHVNEYEQFRINS